MAEERVYKIQLRDAKLVPRQYRVRQAVMLVKKFLVRHLKGKPVLGQKLNEALWARSIKKPPGSIRVHAYKDGEFVRAELVGVDIVKPGEAKVEAKTEKKVKPKDEKQTETKTEPKIEEKPKSAEKKTTE